MSDKKQSSIDWLEQEFVKLEATVGVHSVMYELIEQAKAMHKKEIIEAYLNASPIEDGITIAVNNGNDYYSETYEDNNE